MTARPWYLAAAFAITIATPPVAARLIGGQIEHQPASDPAAEVVRREKTPGTVWLAWTVPAREQGVFALSQLEDGTPQLLALLRESGDREVKRQAIFWLGQSDDPRATAELERLLTR
ncbi:MAG: HEAT repeat domain-containing protein [Thermoanaerobaculia bacterium]